MKGAYSIPTTLLTRYTEMNLFPDNTYFFDSGGNPKYITKLSFDELVKFHEKYYHPSNSKIFVSGVATDVDKMNDTLSTIDEYLNEFEENLSVKDQSIVKYQKKNIEAPIVKSYPYQVTSTDGEDNSTSSSSDGQHIIQVSWLINDDPLTPLQELTLFMLDQLLMSESSILKKTLLESQLGDYVVGGLSSDMIQQYYSMGLSGVHEEDVFQVETLVLDTIQEVAQKGFTDNEISATINSVEFMVSLSYCFSNLWID